MDMAEHASMITNKAASDKLHQIHLSRERELMEQIRSLEADKEKMAAFITFLLTPDTTEYEIVHGRMCPLR